MISAGRKKHNNIKMEKKEPRDRLVMPG